MNPTTLAGPVPVSVPTVTSAGAIPHMVGIRAIPGIAGAEAGVPVLSGLPDPARRTTRDRLYAAVVNAGLRWPGQPIELSVFPHPVPAADSGLDAAFAVALLAATDQVPRHMLTGLAVIGELGLDGSLRPVPDAARRLAVAARAGIGHAVIPAGNHTDTAAGVTVHPAGHLRSLADLLRAWPPPAAWPHRNAWPDADLPDLPATHPGRRILEIAAAGGHHLAFIGPTGSGTVILAHRLPGLLPDLDEPTAVEVAQLHRAAGLSDPDAPPPARPLWQAPHHTISLPALVGGRNRPGAVSLAHGGVLFCDEAGELPAPAVDALRTVLDHRRVVLGTGASPGQVVYPARVHLVAATTGCPQPASAGSVAGCGCPPGVHRRYLARLSRLLDRVDIHATLPAIAADPTAPPGETSADVARRVARARAVAAARWARRRGGSTNGDAGSDALKASLTGVPAERFEPLAARVAAGRLSTRGAASVLRLAWTVADLAGHPHPTAEDVTDAITLRTGPDATPA